MSEDSIEVIERLTRMETKLDVTLSVYHERFSDHEERIRVVESAIQESKGIQRWKVTTGAALAVALITAAAEVLGKLV